MGKVLLETKNLVKKFNLNDSAPVLNNVNFALKEREFVSVMGPSGSGKSTLLYSVSGMDKITSGEVKFKGLNISSHSEKQMSKIRLESMGIIFQQMYMLKHLSIMDNIILPAYTAKHKSREKINEKAEKLMKTLEIDHIKNHKITQVSGGQLQRACICRALINEPDILFADEPTGALNSKVTKEVLEILTKLNNDGTAIMMISHDVKVAAHADKVIYFVDGIIQGELILDKFNPSQDIAQREQKLQEWLREKGW